MSQQAKLVTQKPGHHAKATTWRSELSAGHTPRLKVLSSTLKGYTLASQCRFLSTSPRTKTATKCADHKAITEKSPFLTSKMAAKARASKGSAANQGLSLKSRKEGYRYFTKHRTTKALYQGVQTSF